MEEIFKHISRHIVCVKYDYGSLYWGIKLNEIIIMFKIKNIHKKPENRINRLIYLSMLHYINVYITTYNPDILNVKLIKEAEFDISLLPVITNLAIPII